MKVGKEKNRKCTAANEEREDETKKNWFVLNYQPVELRGVKKGFPAALRLNPLLVLSAPVLKVGKMGLSCMVI